MVAYAPVGRELSGGIDSCLILGLASATSQSQVEAFTIGFDDAHYDETPIVREMAEPCITLSAEELYGHLETTL